MSGPDDGRLRITLDDLEGPSPPPAPPPAVVPPAPAPQPAPKLTVPAPDPAPARRSGGAASSGTHLLTVHELGDADDDDLFPGLGVDGRVALRAGEQLLWHGVCGISAYFKPLDAKKLTTAWEVPEKARVALTDQRVAYVIDKFDKGSTYYGGFIIDTAIMTAVSKARAASRRRGKAAVGQVRYQWPLWIVVAKPSGLLRSTQEVRVGCQEASELVQVHFSLPADEAPGFAARMAEACARVRLTTAKDLDADQRASLEAHARRPVPTPQGNGTDIYRMPGALKVGFV